MFKLSNKVNILADSQMSIRHSRLFFTERQNFRLFQIESTCRRHNKRYSKLRFCNLRVENIVGKEKMLVTSIFSFFHYVFTRLQSQGH